MRRKSKEEKAASAAVAAKMPAAPSIGRPAKVSRNSVYIFASALFLIVFFAIFIAMWPTITVLGLIVAVLAGLVVAYSIRVVPQWERAVVLRLGKLNRCVGPGICFVIPVVEHVTAHVDQRIIATPFVAEEALTADLVPLNIDAVLFWMVRNPMDACTEVEDYPSAVWWAAQTALRDAIGRINLAEVATRRKQIDSEVKEVLDENIRDWGIEVVAVQIRDIAIPKELQDAMSLEAQAERERNARLILAEVEKDISEMFVEAASTYDENEKAMQLRTMNLIYESVKEKGGLVIAPSAFSEGFNNIQSYFKK